MLKRLYYHQALSLSTFFFFLLKGDKDKIVVPESLQNSGENTTYFSCRVMKGYMVMLAAMSYQKRSETDRNFHLYSVMLVNSLPMEWDRKLLFMTSANARDFKLNLSTN